MCGIIFTLRGSGDVILSANTLKHRGPDNYHVFKDTCVEMLFYRLKINDLTDNGNQPLRVGNCWLICNGEIFNHHSLQAMFSFETKSKSDCEIILHLYIHFKKLYKNRDNIVLHTLSNMLDGEFAFCLYDADDKKVFYARDPYGVRPLFLNRKTYSAASELKAFEPNCHSDVLQFTPGHFSILYLQDKGSQHEFVHSLIYTPPLVTDEPYTNDNYENILSHVKSLLTKAVTKRLMSDRNVCALLSGGLDSSLVAALVSKHMDRPLQTFSIGFENSPDLQYASQVAKFINSQHTNVTVTPEEFLDALEKVIYVIESYDTTSVRASVGNYLVSKYIAENSDCVVVFNGDYADEVCGGYRYVKNCSSESAFHDDCVNRVRDIHFFDSLRSDRCISHNGLEARVPFADKNFVEYYMKIPPKYRMSNSQIEKKIVRDAFENENLLPKEVLWRPKEAFSDGVSQHTNSWGDIVKAFIDKHVSDEEFSANNYMQFKLKETYYYHKLFRKYYNNDHIIPYLWMPRFCDENVIDPSARKL